MHACRKKCVDVTPSASLSRDHGSHDGQLVELRHLSMRAATSSAITACVQVHHTSPAYSDGIYFHDAASAR